MAYEIVRNFKLVSFSVRMSSLNKDSIHGIENASGNNRFVVCILFLGVV